MHQFRMHFSYLNTFEGYIENAEHILALQRVTTVTKDEWPIRIDRDKGFPFEMTVSMISTGGSIEFTANHPSGLVFTTSLFGSWGSGWIAQVGQYVDIEEITMILSRLPEVFHKDFKRLVMWRISSLRDGNNAVLNQRKEALAEAQELYDEAEADIKKILAVLKDDD